jgi:hypothetical protein
MYAHVVTWMEFSNLLDGKVYCSEMGSEKIKGMQAANCVGITTPKYCRRN